MKNPQMTYVGFTTKDIRERIDEHNRKLTRTTAPHIPWKIEVVVSFVDKQKAQAFETYLKNSSGYAFAKRHFWSANSGLSALRSFAEQREKQIDLGE